VLDNVELAMFRLSLYSASMNQHSRFDFLLSLMSPEQQAALAVVQSALVEDPDCLERKKVDEQEKVNEKCD